MRSLKTPLPGQVHFSRHAHAINPDVYNDEVSHFLSGFLPAGVCDWCEMCGLVCKCSCSLFIAPGLQRRRRQVSESSTHRRGCVHLYTLTPWQRDGVKQNKASCLYNSQFKQQFKALQRYLMFAERPSARLSLCVMRLSIYWLLSVQPPDPARYTAVNVTSLQPTGQNA